MLWSIWCFGRLRRHRLPRLARLLKPCALVPQALAALRVESHGRPSNSRPCRCKALTSAASWCQLIPHHIPTRRPLQAGSESTRAVVETWVWTQRRSSRAMSEATAPRLGVDSPSPARAGNCFRVVLAAMVVRFNAPVAPVREQGLSTHFPGEADSGRR